MKPFSVASPRATRHGRPYRRLAILVRYAHLRVPASRTEARTQHSSAKNVISVTDPHLPGASAVVLPPSALSQAISVWSNNSAVPSANANTFSSDESGSSGSSDEEASVGGGRGGAGETPSRRGSTSAFGARSVYRNSLRLSRKWVRKGGGGSSAGGRVLRPPAFCALATSPCGCMFAAACKGSEDVTVWLRRRSMPATAPGGPGGPGKPWEAHGGGDAGPRNGPAAAVYAAGAGGRGSGSLEQQRVGGPWNFQPATVLNNEGPLVQVVWGRGPGAQQDYLLTLGEDGRCGAASFLVALSRVFVLAVAGLKGGWERSSVAVVSLWLGCGREHHGNMAGLGAERFGVLTTLRPCDRSGSTVSTHSCEKNRRFAW